MAQLPLFIYIKMTAKAFFSNETDFNYESHIEAERNLLFS